MGNLLAPAFSSAHWRSTLFRKRQPINQQDCSLAFKLRTLLGVSRTNKEPSAGHTSLSPSQFPKLLIIDAAATAQIGRGGEVWAGREAGEITATEEEIPSFEIQACLFTCCTSVHEPPVFSGNLHEQPLRNLSYFTWAWIQRGWCKEL